MLRVSPEDYGIDSIDDEVVIVDPKSEKKELMKIGHSTIS